MLGSGIASTALPLGKGSLQEEVMLAVTAGTASGM